MIQPAGRATAYLNRNLRPGLGGEWLWGRRARVGPIAPRAPCLIWVHGLMAGDVMVDRSIRGNRLRPLGLWWTAARWRGSQSLRELAGRVAVIFDGWAGGSSRRSRVS